MTLPIGNRHRTFAPQGIYPCLGDDKWISISVENNDDWKALTQCMDNSVLENDPRFTNTEGRREHHDEIDQHIAQWTSQKDAFIAMEILQLANVPAGVVNSGEQLVHDPQLVSSGFWEYSGRGPSDSRPYLSRPFQFSKTPGATQLPAPLLGEHTEEVLREVAGMSDEEITELATLGVTANDPLSFK